MAKMVILKTSVDLSSTDVGKTVNMSIDNVSVGTGVVSAIVDYMEDSTEPTAYTAAVSGDLLLTPKG